ncbi:membrane protein required for colicin V production [Prolixibacter denitrificans]|uniref:Colicin V production protein n=2 Tax=Prolixibacter denitrificans TaxID=1541063 RepID=A0A2P8CL96_9BACT|nr:membrane protein required for colicin V production [Prolixibacter denitrificans]GET20330.1 colicin V production protein [Prolixibacter denitrificans]
MNVLDIILGAILVFAAIRGFQKGFFIELASIAALLLGIWGAVEFSGFTAYYLHSVFDWNPEHLGLIAFILTFILVVVAVHLVARLADTLFKAIALGMLTRLAGVVVGVLKAAFIISVLLILIEMVGQYTFNLIPPEKANNSVLYKPLRNFAPSILPFFHFDEAKKELKEGVQQVSL